MPSPISLTVTPGYTFPVSSSRIGATELNLAANPTVELEANGGITSEFLDMEEVASAVGDAATRNYLQKGSFAYEDWQLGTGLLVPAGGSGSNAQSWYARPTGGPVTVLRVEDSPGNKSTWGAELQAGTGLTSLDYYTWIPPAVGGSFRAGDVVFSVWVKNLTLSAINMRLFCDVAGNTNEINTLANQVLGDLVSVPSNTWTRLELTADAATLLLQNGSGWGVRTTALTTAGNAIRVAEAQFEALATATAFTRPGPPPASLAFLRPLTDTERVLGGQVVVQLGTGELRLLPNPPLSLAKPVLSFDRANAIPQWIESGGFIEIYQHTGGDQRLTVPAGLSITGMEIYCWGAGAAVEDNRPGGVGGYAYAEFPCTAGDQFTLVVGGAGTYGTGVGAPYGFGGAGNEVGCGGGGLSGLFSGTGPVLASDAARALLIAGGGGGCAYNNYVPGSATSAGGNGGDTDPAFAGGAASMQGASGSSGFNGGGGGYAGGLGSVGFAARGGTSFRKTSGGAGTSPTPTPNATAGGLEFTARSTPVASGQQLIVPGSTNQYYQDQAGLHGKNGLIVIKWVI